MISHQTTIELAVVVDTLVQLLAEGDHVDLPAMRARAEDAIHHQSAARWVRADHGDLITCG